MRSFGIDYATDATRLSFRIQNFEHSRDFVMELWEVHLNDLPHDVVAHSGIAVNNLVAKSYDLAASEI